MGTANGSRWGMLAGLCSTLCACGTSLHGHIDDVEKKIQDQNARLDAIQHDIVLSEARAADARRRADFQDCRALASSIKAEMTFAVARCEETKAHHSECGARNEAHTAESSVLGCLLGIGLTVATSGAGAPLAMAGCGGGYLYGRATTGDCPQVTCSDDPNDALRTALATHHLDHFPLCGGTLRVTVGAAAQVTSVEPNGPAAQAGIALGDVIIGVSGARTETAEDLVRVLNNHAPGEVVDVAYVRGAQAFHLPLRLAEPK